MLGYQHPAAIGKRDFWSIRLHFADRERVVVELPHSFDRGWHVHSASELVTVMLFSTVSRHCGKIEKLTE